MTKRNLEREIEFKYNFKQYLKIARPYKWLFSFIIFLVLVYETIHLIEKYLFKIILDKGEDFVGGNVVKGDFVYILIVIGVVYVILSIIKIFNHWFRIGGLNKLETNMIYDLKRKFFNHIIKLSHGFHTTHKTGSLIARLNRGGSAVERISDFLVFNVAPLVLQVVLVGVAIIYFDVASALVILLTAILFIVFGLFVTQIQKKDQILANDAEDFEKGSIADIFTNIDSIKYFGKEKLIEKRYENLSNDTKNKFLKLWNYHKIFGTGETIILGIGTFFAIYFPLLKFLDGGISIGTIAFIYTAYGGLIGPLFGFVYGIRGFFISLGDFQELCEYDKIKNDIEDKPNSPKLKIKMGEVEFRDISFIYSSKKTKAIDNLNLIIRANEKIALVGHSGCGKTTLVKLLYRFYDVNSGEILIDGKNIKNFKQESLRSELSIVPQECILFDDTIYNNIAFSNPSASKEDVMKAIKFAQLDKFINELPLKDNTIVGERGVKLSGGERQRVSIARAILANKKILVLDEATSSLDSETEHEIQRDLKKLMKGRTSIIIAHRLSTIMGADKIVVIDKGKIVQSGRHFELIKQEGTYKRLWNLQKGGYLRE